MERKGGVFLRAGVLFASAGALATISTMAAAAAPVSTASTLIPRAMITVAVDDDQPIERHVAGFVQKAWREIRHSVRTFGRLVSFGFSLWGDWLQRAIFSLGVAIIAALADGGLVTAWRAQGLRTMATYSSLMLYVYGRLLFSSGVGAAPKLLLFSAVAYGIFRRDLVPDRSLVPGRIDDVVLIVVATRAFVYACPEALVQQYADRALTLRQRVWSSERAR